MFDPKMVEAVARGMCKAHGTGQCAAICLSHSSAFTSKGNCPEAPRVHDVLGGLTALCAHLNLPPEALNALASGEAVVVPRKVLEVLQDKLLFVCDEGPEGEGWKSTELQEACDEIDRVLAASPYAPKGGSDA